MDGPKSIILMELLLKDSEVKLSYDLFYMRNFPIWLDLLILLKTIRLVFNAKGTLSKN